MLMTPFVCFTLKIALLFFEYINTSHPNIRFTMERKVEKRLPFLDIMLGNGHSSLITTVFSENDLKLVLLLIISALPLCRTN